MVLTGNGTAFSSDILGTDAVSPSTSISRATECSDTFRREVRGGLAARRGSLLCESLRDSDAFEILRPGSVELALTSTCVATISRTSRMSTSSGKV
jgi:hypothetical protein